MERLHLRVRTISEYVQNTTRYERSIASGALNRQIDSLQSQKLRDGLRGSVKSVPMMSAVFAESMAAGSLNVAASDVVVCGNDLGEVHVCALEDRNTLI